MLFKAHHPQIYANTSFHDKTVLMHVIFTTDLGSDSVYLSRQDTQTRSYDFRVLKFAKEGLTWLMGIDVFGLLHTLAILICSVPKTSIQFPLTPEH